jgi:hypothetical protein
MENEDKIVENRLIVDKFALAKQFNKETLNIINSIIEKSFEKKLKKGKVSIEDVEDEMFESFDEYDKNEINKILDLINSKKIQNEIGQANILLSHTELFYLTLNRKAYTFLRYFTENY